MTGHLTIRLVLDMNDHHVHSNLIESQGSHQVTNGQLVIYLVIDDIDANSDSTYVPAAMSEVLVKFCGIRDAQDAQLLTHILWTDNERLLERDLRDRRNRMPGSARSLEGGPA